MIDSKRILYIISNILLCISFIILIAMVIEPRENKYIKDCQFDTITKKEIKNNKYFIKFTNEDYYEVDKEVYELAKEGVKLPRSVCRRSIIK